MNLLEPTGRWSRPRSRRFTSVTRWLLVVAGCTGLELVQPAFAADPETTETTGTETSVSETAAPAEPQASPAEDAARNDSTILYPSDNDGRLLGGPRGDRNRSSAGWVVAGVLLVGAGVWVWLQRRQLTGRAAGARIIDIEETKSLGNRQFLVVASCDGRRLLLGVSPGRINTLADLDEFSTESIAASTASLEDKS